MHWYFRQRRRGCPSEAPLLPGRSLASLHHRARLLFAFPGLDELALIHCGSVRARQVRTVLLLAAGLLKPHQVRRVSQSRSKYVNRIMGSHWVFHVFSPHLSQCVRAWVAADMLRLSQRLRHDSRGWPVLLSSAGLCCWSRLRLQNYVPGLVRDEAGWLDLQSARHQKRDPGS